MTKKLCALLLMLVCLFGFAGCGATSQNYIEQESKNLTTYDIVASFDKQNKKLNATQKVAYKNNTGIDITEVKFHLYPNAFREDAKYKAVADKDVTNAYPDGVSYGGIEVTQVKVGGQKTFPHVGGVDKNILTVPLQNTLKQGDVVELQIDFVDTLPKVAHRYGYTDNGYYFGNWYPIACVYDGGWVTDVYCTNGDPFYSQMANYNVEISYPKGMQIAATGDHTTSNDGNKTVCKSTAKTVRDFAFVLGDNFKVATDKVGDTTVKYFYFKDDNYKQNLQISCESVATFGEMIGAYPYKSLCVVQTDFLYGGMEFPNLVYISSALDEVGQKQVIVHEIAHQWWYNLVGNNQVANAWMDEGLTEFSTAMFFKLNDKYNDKISYDRLVKNAERSYTMFVDVLDSFSGGANTTMTRASNQYATEQEYICMTYTKGMLLFENLMFGMGQDKMQKCMKKYFNDNKCKIAKPQNMIDSFSKASGTNLNTFFANWLDGKVVIGA